MLSLILLAMNASNFGYAVATFFRFPEKRRWPVLAALSGVVSIALVLRIGAA
ncbi:hypothetical protein [Brevundimonas sp. GCM10030266]|uniref:hypothetical protein n=1 Tax=Brevundimonas sp. GCM10030266 TaxID=3273386 RepID=UPI00360A445A